MAVSSAQVSNPRIRSRQLEQWADVGPEPPRSQRGEEGTRAAVHQRAYRRVVVLGKPRPLRWVLDEEATALPAPVDGEHLPADVIASVAVPCAR